MIDLGSWLLLRFDAGDGRAGAAHALAAGRSVRGSAAALARAALSRYIRRRPAADAGANRGRTRA